MSKIIVDQIQKNGGDVLTLPTNDATANNQPLVGSTTGVLSHSPLSLPAADGAANRPVTTDGSAQLQFGAFSLPTGTGANGQTLATDGAGGTSWSPPPDNLPNHTNSDNIIGTVVTTSGQQNSYSTGDWTSSGPWTTYRHDNFFNSSTNYIQGWNMFMSDGYPNSPNTDRFYSNNTGYDLHRETQFAANYRVGYNYKDHYHNDNESSYGGFSWRCLPIRNGGSSSVTVNIYAYASSYTTYAGCSLGYFTPTYSSGTNYANVTGGSWTQISSYNANSEAYNMTGSITIPAGTTVLVFCNAARAYKTTYRFMDTNYFYNLHTTFASADVYCDLKMLQTLAEGRCTHMGQTTDSTFYIYNHCANLFGDR